MIMVHSGQKFAWDAVPGATAYDFQIQNASMTAVLSDKPNLSVTEITVEEACATLTMGPTYNARVRAKDMFGSGEWSPVLAFQIVGPAVPANLHVV